MYSVNDNIIALATNPKKSTINVVRCSGSTIFDIYKKLTKTKKKPKANSAYLKPLYSVFDGSIIDKAVVVSFVGPKSFTGEDMVEFSLHGGELLVEKLTQNLLSLDCRLADPGEFSYRAFINEKIDLVQAEAINNLVSAENYSAIDYSIKNLTGELSNKIKNIIEKLTKTITIMEHELDFNENEIDFTSYAAYVKKLKKIEDDLLTITTKSFLKNEQKNDFTVCLAGRVNVGKSSIFNKLLGYNRALVSRSPGTTRDAVEKTFNINSVSTTLIDTAGVRKTTNKVESLGIDLSYKNIKKASLVLFVDDKDPVGVFEKLKIKKNNVLFIQNKIDKNKKTKKDVVFLSCKNNIGFFELTTLLSTKIKDFENKKNNMGLFMLSVRQKKEIDLACKKIKKSIDVYKKTKDVSVVLSFLYDVLSSLNLTLRPKDTDYILNNIFKGFCVGK